MSPSFARSLNDTVHSNASAYTLATVRDDDDDDNGDGDTAPLLSPLTPREPSYGTAPLSPTVHNNSRRIIFNAALKMGVIFLVSSLFLGGTLWLALPTLDEDDRPFLRIPKSFAQLQDLNLLLKKYRDIYPYRIVVCYVTTYLFLQAFSLPGSMYLSILGGAVWGVARALPLACACVATGGTLCYLISAALGPALLTIPRIQSRLDKWTDKIHAQRANIIPFLIVLRIAPLPPHWVVNVICPHVGIGIVPFWISTFLGIFGVSVIHTTIGGGLDQMTSADDFHLISWRNFFGLSAVVVGVLIPVGIRYVFQRETAALALPEEEVEETAAESVEGDTILAEGPRVVPGQKGKTPQLVLLSDEEDEDLLADSGNESDGDVILEAGPALVVKADELSPRLNDPQGSRASTPSDNTHSLLE
ncbi:hypothetical protein HETIRDRAFT_316448 [Heterobasidion irregulare TC 32-1]|uniref:VTT domain-containing protein n=1 Tax=Heterobasidion irregulare (strain TC 32-1) TaxID=747525 RepID=W4KB05_HETIT|nr:uncharacterized protein HETIRDRAFT_316448 [Heterobasidion irregulare TC 32-1]ETW82904.1 hypothetical protein HETIRDRAFT_316448 [Heterobasidion irregulare TC 32-1]